MAESVRLAPAMAAITTPPVRPTSRTSAAVAPQRRPRCARAAIHTALIGAPPSAAARERARAHTGSLAGARSLPTLSLVGGVTGRAPPGSSGLVAACQALTLVGFGLTLSAARFGGLALASLQA